MNLELFRKNVGRYEKKCTTLKMLIIGLTFLTAIVSILFLFASMGSVLSEECKYSISLSVLLLSIFSLLFTNIYTQMVNKYEIYKYCISELSATGERKVFSQEEIVKIILIIFQTTKDELVAFKSNSDEDKNGTKNERKEKLMQQIDEKREERRKKLIPTMCIVATLIFIFSVVWKKFLILVSGGCLVSIAYIYLDYLPHANYYAQKYNMRCCNSSGNALEGLARIYKWEYEKTRFYRKDPFYLENKTYSFECILNILDVVYRDKRSYWNIINYILIVLNCMSIFIGWSSQNFEWFSEYFGMRFLPSYYLVQIILIFIISIINIIQLFSVKDFYEYMVKIAFSTYLDEDKNEYVQNLLHNDQIENHFISETMLVRGIFQYNSKQFDRGKKIEEINCDERMLFTHKAIANISRLNFTMFLIYIWFAYVALFIFDYVLLAEMILAAVCIAIYIGARIWILPRIGRKKIVSKIEELILEESKGL